jgi:hypothetical protein
MTHDRLDTPIPCYQEALEGGFLCFHHQKYADGLTDPPPEKSDDAQGGRESESLRSVTNTQTNKTIWTRQEKP